MIRVRSDEPMNELIVTFEDPSPEDKARAKAQHERFRRNSRWLQTHWSDLLPRARGKHLAVAGEEAFVADSGAEAWALAKAAHPEDDGAFSHYVPATDKKVERIYADCG